MSLILILWKAPLVPDPCAADVLLRRWYKRQDDSELEPSESIAAFTAELLSRHPADGSGGAAPAWAEAPFATQRIVELSLARGAGPELVDDICTLAHAHGLLVYEPTSGAISLPCDPPEADKLPRTRARDWIRVGAMAAPILGATCLAWTIPIGWIRWPLVAVGAFFSIAALIVVGSMIAGSLGLLGEQQEPVAS